MSTRSLRKSTPKAIGVTFAILGFLVANFVWIPRAFAAPGDSAEDPIIVTDCEQLQDIDDDTANYDKHYALGNDIDCDGSEAWDGGKGFNPIASNDIPFTGTLNGNHHTITNVTILRADDTQGEAEGDEESVGLFAWTSGADISDLNIDTSKVKGYAFVGGIVGWAENTLLTNVSFNATVVDNSCNPGHCVWARYGTVGGGIAGMLHNSAIFNGVTSGPVKGSGNTIGGLVGQMGTNSSITSSSSSSNIDGGHKLGGAVGLMEGGELVDVHASGVVDANVEEDYKNGYAAGGLVGAMQGSASVSHSSATGDVHADYSAAGGLVGNKDGVGTIEDSYATGDVTQGGSSMTGGNAGGLIGEFFGGVIERTYASGSVTAEYAVGALVGNIINNGPGTTVHDSFGAGLVTATGDNTSEPYDGGLVGNQQNWSAEFDHYYYDATRTGMDHCLAGYPEGYWESPATINDECIAINEDGENSSYFFNQSNRPFHNGEDEVWSTDVWDFHEDDYPTFECDECRVIEEDEDVAVLETLQANNITATSADLHGEAQLNSGATINDIPNTLLVGFILNDSSIVNWDNFIHSAPVDDVAAIESDDTHIAFNGMIDDLACETQYWYVAAYTYNTGEGYIEGLADNIETFTTASCPTDGDNDGISNEVEDAAPNEGDGNNDGQADAEQSNVASFVNTLTDKYVTVAISEDCELSSASASGEDENWVKDTSFNYTTGFVNFTADCGDPGMTADVTIIYHDTALNNEIVRKYNPSTQSYFTIDSAVVAAEEIGNGSVSVSYQVIDGGQLDVNGEEDGTIVDPVGLGTVAASNTSGQDGVGAPNTGLEKFWLLGIR